MLPISDFFMAESDYEKASACEQEEYSQRTDYIKQ